MSTAFRAPSGANLFSVDGHGVSIMRLVTLPWACLYCALQYVDPGFTSQMEEQLDEVSRELTFLFLAHWSLCV